MPRLPRSLLAKAWKQNPLLPLLLRSCRDLESARRELRWLDEHAVKLANKSTAKRSWRLLLQRFCHERARGKPLQYILGTEYFGPLEIECQSGVLIPRPETAASVSQLVERLHNAETSALPKRLRVLDLCSGSGCISLLFAHLFPIKTTKVEDLQVLGIDISPKAVRLALHNQSRLLNTKSPSAVCKVDFVRANILENSSNSDTPDLLQILQQRRQSNWDIIISNPPYISPLTFHRDTTRSVRNFEPRLALVPKAPSQSISDEEQGDMFYPRLLEIAEHVSAKVLLVEVADMAQAERVAAIVKSNGLWDIVEIWCDDPATDVRGEGRVSGLVEGVKVVGKGNGRSVFCWRGDGSSWLGKG